MVSRTGNDTDDVAIEYLGTKITYGRLLQNIDMTAAAFRKAGVKAGDIVALAMPNIPENVYCIYALNKLGAVADLVDLRSKGETLVHYLNEGNASVAVICDLFAENANEIADQTNITTWIVASPFDSVKAPLRAALKLKRGSIKMKKPYTLWKNFMRSADVTDIRATGNGDDAACIFHTSGTTGESKGVVLSNKAFNAMAVEGKHNGTDTRRYDRLLNQVPPFLAYNTLVALNFPLYMHMTIVMLPEYNPKRFAEKIMKAKINIAFAGPADWQSFLDVKQMKDVSYLRTMVSGSDSLNEQRKQEINARVQAFGSTGWVLEGYGMTEVGSAACCNVPLCTVPNSVGIPMPQNLFCVVDPETGKELPYNETGEICMTGPTVMIGYLNRPQATAEVLKIHDDGRVWVHSGDLGHIDENGCVFIDGRIKRIIVRHDGIKISPFNIEHEIMQHERVKACCVVGKKDTDHSQGKVAAAFIVPMDTADTENLITEVKNICESKLAELYWPVSYEILNELPLTPNGKVDYRKMEQMAEKTCNEGV